MDDSNTCNYGKIQRSTTQFSLMASFAVHHEHCSSASVVEDCLCLGKRRIRDWKSYLWRSRWVVIVQRLLPSSPRDCEGCSYTFCFETWSAVCTNIWPMYRVVDNWLKWPAWPVVFYKEMDLHMKLQLRMMCNIPNGPAHYLRWKVMRLAVRISYVD